MSKWNVYVTRRLPDKVMDDLAEHCDVEVNPEDRVLTRTELLAKVGGRDGVICLLNDRIDDMVLQAAAGARIFANYAVGFDNIDLESATRRGIMVSNTPGVLTEATADMAWALLFAVARRIVAGDRMTREGRFKGWGPTMLLGQDITGRTLGVVGAGRIGLAFAKKAAGFAMRVVYHDVEPNPEFEAATGGKYVELDNLLRQSDFVSLHVSLLPATRRLIGADQLKLMKETAILINTARGPVVDEKALVDALREGRIWGAGLDVYEEEPALAPGLVGLENAVLAPHIASATWDTRTNMGRMAIDNLLAALRGELPPQCLNPEVYHRRKKLQDN